MKTELSHVFFLNQLFYFFLLGVLVTVRIVYYCCYSITRIKEYFQIVLICYLIKTTIFCWEHAKRPISETGRGNSFL